MLSQYSIEPFTPDKFLLMKELFRSAYGIDIDQNYFNKKYNTSRLGHSVIGFIAFDKTANSPAAFYGVFPIKILINGTEVLAAQSGDTMTHKDHQKKGLFVHLAQITFEECNKKGIELIFGLPNNNSYHGFTKKLNWKHVDDVERFDLKSTVKRLPLPKIFQRLGWNHLFERFARRILKNYLVATQENFMNPLPVNYGKLVRDTAYLDYKSERNKTFIRIESIIFWIKLTDVFWIGEISDYEKMNDQILSQLKRVAYRLGYNTIVFHINKSIGAFPFLSGFTKYESEPLCFYYINQKLENTNLLITGADFDTW